MRSGRRRIRSGPQAPAGSRDQAGCSLVQNLQRVAPARISSLQAGQVLVAGPGVGLGSRTLVMAKATNAMTTNVDDHVDEGAPPDGDLRVRLRVGARCLQDDLELREVDASEHDTRRRA